MALQRTPPNSAGAKHETRGGTAADVRRRPPFLHFFGESSLLGMNYSTREGFPWSTAKLICSRQAAELAGAVHKEAQQ